MFSLKIENRFGEVLRLTQNQNYIVSEIEGLDPPQASINLADVAGMAGGLFNSAKVETRNLVLTVLPRPPVEKNRLALYKYVQSGQWCKIYYSNGSLKTQIEGYVETVEAPLFTKTEQVQVSIICPKPYFEGLKEIYNDISSIVSNFTFPFAIDKRGIEFSYTNHDMLAHVTNYGDVNTGVIITITAHGEVVNPRIYNNDTRGSISINITLQEYDQLTINTNSGNRDISLTRDNQESSVINKMLPNPEWFVLTPGENVFSYEADAGQDMMSVMFRHRTLYGGV